MSTPIAPPAGGHNGQDCANLSGSQALLCLIANPYASSLKETAVFAALGYSIGSMFLITFLFSLMRPHNSVVYAPKLRYADEKHAPPRIGKGLFAWFGPIVSLKEPQLVEKIGLDGTIFLRFTRMCRNMFAVMTAVAIGVLVPTNVISSGKVKKELKFEGGSFWVTSTPQYVSGAGLWVHVASAWVMNFIVAFFLWRNYVAVTRLRRQYFESADYLQGLHSRTLIFTDIPPASRSDEGILRLADEVEHTAALPRAAIARNVRELPDLIEEHEEAVRELEVVLSKYLKNPDRLPLNRPTMRPSGKYRKENGSGKVDAIEYLTERISGLEVDIKHVRESIDKRNPMPFGFASYERIEDAHTVAYAAKSKHPHGTTIRLAPRPNDLIWKNLPLSKRERRWKRFINNFWIGVLTIVWIAPNALIAIFLSNLLNLAHIWKAFGKDFSKHKTIWSIVQGIASPALTSLVYLILPIIFRRLSIHAGDTTKTARERHVTTRLYAFFVFNNLIVFSAFSAMWTYVSLVIFYRNDAHEGIWDAIKSGGFYFQMLTGLCEVTPFWLTWLLQRNLGSAADIAQILNLTWGWFNRKFLSPTPRQAIEWTAPPPMDYAVYYNYFLFYSTVALCFITLQPLVIPITTFFFAADYWLKKYLLLYVLITKTESGGQYWWILFNRLVFATVLADVIIALVVKASGTWIMVAAMGPLPILMVIFKFYCSKAFDDQNEFYTKATLKDPVGMIDAGHKRHRNDRVSTKFGHPALYAKLMTPMVHAKAEHRAGDILRGRLNTENTQAPSTYSERAIDMGPMSQQHPGKSARFAPDIPKQKELFEAVPESQLDFGYYKDRPDFAEENGGDGELYGRPTDLISERSTTPRSFMGHGGGGSGASSRASSPGGADGGSRTVSPHHLLQMHPAYRDQAANDLSERRQMYRNSNDSGRSLLNGAQPVGFADEEPHYGMDRWRNGGSGGPNQERVVVKTAPTNRLNNEAQTLQLFQGCHSIRQLVDQIEDPESVVVEYMDDNVLNLLRQKQLSKVEAKRALRATIEALIALHDRNIVHTDIKPDNILVKYRPWGNQYKLGDLGDSAPSNVPSNDGGHLIGAEIFCAPEVPLGIPWTTKADIWAVGATGITLITGNYIFLPQNAPPTGDPRLSMGVLQMQNDYYGPVGSEAFKDLVDDSVRPLLLQLEENHRPFSLAAASRNIAQKDIDFFDYIMKVDPRQRPTAREALRHPWFNEL